MKSVFHKEIISYVEQSDLSKDVSDRTSSNAYCFLTDGSSHVNLIIENRRIV